jgi:NAD(P)-dependent dehydrogenase (short-subunit alcohol dehydrogenase family)
MTSQTPDLVPAIEDWGKLLDGKVAIVTGGGAGIGGAISRLFAQHGALVEIAEIDPERAEQARADIEGAGGTVRTHVVDVTDNAVAAPLVQDVVDTHGRVDILINNVGDYRPQTRFQSSDPESWEAMYAINLRHMFAMCRAAMDPMIAARKGTIVNFHSVEGMRGYPGDPVYGAMKAGAAHFTTCLAVTMGRYGIRVNGIGTDLTQTPQVDYLTRAQGHDDMWPVWAPVGRLGWPEDQARVALFLASDLSSYITGHNIPVDGGTKAGGGWFFSERERIFTNRPIGF